MYTTVQSRKSSVSPEALQACLIAARAQFTSESLRFFLRSLLQSFALNYQKSKHYYDAYILWKLIPTPSLIQLTPVRDGDRSPCLVTPRADEHKRPIHIHAHIPHAASRTHKILSLFISNKNTRILQ